MLQKKQTATGIKFMTKILFDRDRTRTCNPQIRSLMPYPLGHTAGRCEGSAGGWGHYTQQVLQAGVKHPDKTH